MIKAYVLINIKPGKENELMNMLKNEKSIEEINLVYGEYDMVLKISAETLEDLRRFVVDKLRAKDYVERTITLIQAP